MEMTTKSILSIILSVLLLACNDDSTDGEPPTETLIDSSVPEVNYLSTSLPASPLTKSTIPAALVISSIEIEASLLMIRGHNFEIGSQDPSVFLDGVPLAFTEQPTDEQIIVDLSSFSGADGYFLLTVSAGSSLNENDTHGILLGSSDPVPSWNQLHIQNNQVVIDEENNEIEITIFGFNFDLGYTPPTVSLGGVALTVNEPETDETQIVVTGPIPDLSQTEYKLLKVETGTLLEKYDVVIANLPVDSEEPEYPPSEGQCTPDGKLCWKEGPWKPSWPIICGFVDWAVPKYNELTKDYEIDLSDFLDAHMKNSELIKLPKMANRYGRSIGSYFTRMTQLPEVAFSHHTENGYKWDFISIEKKQSGTYAGYPVIKMKKGYRWDGTSRPCRRFDSEFRAGLVHDSMYDLIRIKAIPWKDSYNGDDKKQNDRDELNNRELADMLFYWISLEDRVNLAPGQTKPSKPDAAYYTLQHDGMGRANKHIEKDARWRFQTMADAKLSVGYDGMDIDQDGNKSLSTSCASPEIAIEFDASLSRPIPRLPIQESHYKVDGNEMHETTWEWRLNDKTVIPQKQNHFGQLLNESDLLATMPVKDLISNGLILGSENIVSLYIDKGKDPSSRKKYYEKKEDIKVTLNYDSAPPVVSCPENIVAECTGPAGALVTFEAAANDACEGNMVPTCNPSSGAIFAQGETSTVTCKAEDALNNAAQCLFEITVQDTTPPVITNLSTTPDILWPPNGKMVPVEISYTVTDTCDTAPACSITSIKSNESDNTIDTEITGNLTANLRSKRFGYGNGREYTITLECTDTAGNSTVESTSVTVPHDQGHMEGNKH